ncbi:MAG: hypothetical protein FE78DRAFT_409170 [Acidomyces sp. 'richmondensis']|nr:MAG: hypothetical protein FE78DRAFT_409170 [Acidomyces sp. 'richmondensis']
MEGGSLHPLDFHLSQCIAIFCSLKKIDKFHSNSQASSLKGFRHNTRFKTFTLMQTSEMPAAKLDYIKARVYRPIALLNTLAKVLEAIVARRILEEAEQRKLLPES